MEKNIAFKVLALVLSFGVSIAKAEIKSTEVSYKEGSTELQGVLVWDTDLKKDAPAVIVIHEWMGLNEYAIKRAHQLAEMGYVAFAADVYGKGVRPTDPKSAGETAGKYKSDRNLFKKRVKAAYDTLKKQKYVDKNKMAVMGYCFGGTAALELARTGVPLKGVVSFHGGLSNPTPQDAKKIKGKVLVLHGAIDPNVSHEEVDAFMKEMNEAKVDYQFISYANTVHAFTNPAAGNDPSKGAAYNELSDKRSFIAMKDFFTEIFN